MSFQYSFEHLVEGGVIGRRETDTVAIIHGRTRAKALHGFIWRYWDHLSHWRMAKSELVGNVHYWRYVSILSAVLSYLGIDSFFGGCCYT